MSVVHTAIRRSKIGNAYVTDEGRQVPEHPLVAFDCSCGYRSAVFMASEGRALAIFERHLGPAVAWRCDCGASNAWHESFCRSCGAGAPDDEGERCPACGDLQSDGDHYECVVGEPRAAND